MCKTILALMLIVAAVGQGKERNLLRLPGWFTLFEPEGQKIDEQTSDKVRASYDAEATFGSVVGYYETSLHEAGVHFLEEGDGHGTTFEVNSGGIVCKLEIGNQAKPHVEMACANTEASKIGEPKPGEPDAPIIGSDPQPGMHRIEYIVDGTAPAAGLTYQNSGGTMQRDAALPARFAFDAASGAFLYISAQRKDGEGTVRVAIRVDGKVVRESSSSPGYGIASASGRIGK